MLKSSFSNIIKTSVRLTLKTGLFKIVCRYVFNLLFFFFLVDAAIEDIMVLSNTTCEKPLNIPSTGASESNMKVAKAIHHYGFDNYKANTFVNNDDDDSRSVTSSTTLETTMKASVKEEFHADKKNPLPDSNQSFVKASSDNNETSEIDLCEFANSYSYVKAVPFSYERSVLLVRNGVRLMIILRGPPGSGKSYLAKKLLSEAGIDQPRHKNHIFSSDDFFMQNNVYVFDPNLLSQAHMFNQRNVLTATRKHVSPIIVDNTNSQAWEMRVYADLAVSAGYDLEIVEPCNWWLFKESELSKRNVHGVPKAKIRNMIERYEKHITPKKLMQQFELQYSLNNAPPQPVLNTKWKDKLRSFKSNKPKKKKQDMCPRPQAHSSKGNLKNVMPKMTLKPHEFLDSPNLQSTLSCPSPSLPSSSSYNFSYVSNSLVQKSYSPQNINKVHSFAGFDYSKDLISNRNMMLKSQTSTNANEQVFNRRNIPVNLMENPFQAYSPSSSGGAHNKGLPSNVKEDESSDDFKCFESHKLVFFDETLSKSPNVLDNVSLFHNQNETLPVTFCSDMNVGSNKVLSPKVDMCNAVETKDGGHVSELCHTKFKVENLRNMDDKELVAKELVNSLIDTVVTTERKNTISHKEPNEVVSNADVMNELDSLWDYVLVGSNNTFIYKKLHSVPIFSTTLDSNSAISKPNFDQVTCAHLLNQKHEGYCKTNFQKEIHNCNANSRSEKKECSVQTNFETSKEPTALSVFGLDSILKENKVSNIDALKQNCKTFPTEFSNNNCKDIKIEDLKVTKDCPEHISKKDEDVHKTIDLEKEDTQVGKCSTQIHSEKKTEAMRIMENILSSIFPCSQNSSCLLEKNTEINCRENNGSHMLVNCYPPDDRSKEVADKTSNTLYKNDPKPVRKLTRPKIPTNDVKDILYQQNKDYSNFGSWDTVTNAVEHWDPRESENSYELPKERPVSLPQRLTSNKHLIDSSTNTNYHDFSVLSQHNLAEAKVLIGISREITTGCHKSALGVSQTLLLDKSTMTVESTSESVNKLDLSQINILFPHIPESYILDMVEKCQGDIDWAVDLLLDSEHSMYHVHNGSDESTGDSSCINHDVSRNSVFKVNDDLKKIQNPKFVSKNPNTTNENIELKKAIESSVVFNKSHYSDQVLKVLKKKNPEYLSLIESKHVENDEYLKHSDQLPTLEHEIIPEEELEANSSDEENISNCPVGRQEDDDTLELIVNYDLVLQLQQKFGNSSTPKIMSKYY